MFYKAKHRDTVVVLFRTQLEVAVQVDFTRVPRKLKHVEREVGGGVFSISVHLHSLVIGVSTAGKNHKYFL